MKPMEPTPTQPNTTTVICTSCDWSRKVPDSESPTRVLDYHRIQVHNDQDAVRKGFAF